MCYIPFWQAKKKYGIIGAAFGFLQGRCTAAAIVFTTAGIILAFKGKLTADYVALVGAIQALIVAHSMGQDYHERKSQNQQQQQEIVNDITIQK